MLNRNSTVVPRKNASKGVPDLFIFLFSSLSQNILYISMLNEQVVLNFKTELIKVL